MFVQWRSSEAVDGVVHMPHSSPLEHSSPYLQIYYTVSTMAQYIYSKLPFILYLAMILTVIIAIPNTSDDVTIPTAIPTPSPVMQQTNSSLKHVMVLYMWSSLVSRPLQGRKDVFYRPRNSLGMWLTCGANQLMYLHVMK